MKDEKHRSDQRQGYRSDASARNGHEHSKNIAGQRLTDKSGRNGRLLEVRLSGIAISSRAHSKKRFVYRGVGAGGLCWFALFGGR
jgi:hypothetical protein